MLALNISCISKFSFHANLSDFATVGGAALLSVPVILFLIWVINLWYTHAIFTVLGVEDGFPSIEHLIYCVVVCYFQRSLVKIMYLREKHYPNHLKINSLFGQVAVLYRK